MDTAKAKLRFLRMSPRKVRLVADLVRGKRVNDALAQLSFSKKAAARPVRKLIESAVANAVENHKLEREALYIKEIMVDGGPTMKRFRPRAHGRAGMIRKRMSHVQVVLAEKEELKKAKATSKKAPAKKAAPKKEEEKVAEKKPAAKKPAAKKATKPAVKKEEKKEETKKTKK